MLATGLQSDCSRGEYDAGKEVYRILIVEDEPRISAFMEKGLTRAGFSTSVVSDGNAALDTIFREKFDLLLLDLGLPGINGRDILREVRLAGMDLIVIVVTACSIDPQSNKMIYSYADDVVTKPFLMRDLIERVQSFLQHA